MLNGLQYLSKAARYYWYNDWLDREILDYQSTLRFILNLKVTLLKAINANFA